jgi:ribonuclease D
MESPQLPEIDPEELTESAELIELVELPLRDKPIAGMPELITDLAGLKNACLQLAKGTGPIAIDAERASGYKYSQRAYLIQIHRKDGGLHLIAPIPFQLEDFVPLNEILQSCETIIHASTQDLPCMREIGLNPTSLFDTELGSRIAGMAKVGLGPLTEELLGFRLAKEHSAVDWSIRPLHPEWLIYAALDVDVLLDLRDAVEAKLIESNKLAWVKEEFAAILASPAPQPKTDRWKKTSGIHKVKRPDQLAIVRELWRARDEIGREKDIAGGRILSEHAIVAAAATVPKNINELKGISAFTRQPPELLKKWWDAIAIASTNPEFKIKAPPSDSPPTQMRVWREREPVAYARLTHAKAKLKEVATANSIPVENMASPDLVRKLCWFAPLPDLAHVKAALLKAGARKWQIELIAPTLAEIQFETEPLVVATDEAPDGVESA